MQSLCCIPAGTICSESSVSLLLRKMGARPHRGGGRVEGSPSRPAPITRAARNANMRFSVHLGSALRSNFPRIKRARELLASLAWAPPPTPPRLVTVAASRCRRSENLSPAAAPPAASPAPCFRQHNAPASCCSARRGAQGARGSEAETFSIDALV